jgi:hypothetical protein
MSASRLKIYNGALRMLGERKLASLSENREPRRVLDEVWDDDFTDFCLEQGLWNFAMRSIELTYSPSITPAFGYTRAFDKQTDWIRTGAVSLDEFFNTPLIQYVDEGEYWRANHDTLYIKYVSNDSSYGGDLSLWPASFIRYVEAELASQSCERITKSDAKQVDLERKAKRFLAEAKNKDAMNQPAQFPPNGSWVSSRMANSGGNRGRNRSSLLG